MRRVAAVLLVACSSSSATTNATTPEGGSPPPPPSAPVDAGDADPGPTGPPAISFIGRFDTRDPAGPKAAWPGSRIVIRFEGTDLSVRFDDEFDDGRPG